MPIRQGLAAWQQASLARLTNGRLGRLGRLGNGPPYGIGYPVGYPTQDHPNETEYQDM